MYYSFQSKHTNISGSLSHRQILWVFVFVFVFVIKKIHSFFFLFPPSHSFVMRGKRKSARYGSTCP